jgi:DNA-binding NtrC family response regulator
MLNHKYWKAELNLTDLSPILIIDDQLDNRKELTQSLNRIGFPVESASDGLQALDKFRSTKYSIVITNEQTPKIEGGDVLHSVKKISPQIPVIVIAANGTVHNAVEAMQAGASDYLLKPFSIETLEKTVKKAIRLSNGNEQSRYSRKSPGNQLIGREIITRNRKFQDTLSRARSVAPSTATVLIQGESGTGKELLAAYVHHHSRNPQAPYVAVNCAALPDTLAESELFGHEKGSFTGAIGRKIGKFELAKKGTVVLDEISEMPLSLQAKLLRVLQEKEVDRIGGTHPVPIDARVIAISNVVLRTAVTEGRFREDLYYRINVIPLTVPALRERKGDIELLAGHFLKKHCLANHKTITGIDDIALKMLINYSWKGNIRELENTIERAVLIGEGRIILPEHLLLDLAEHDPEPAADFSVRAGYTVREMEKKLIFRTLKDVNDNRTNAAELLGISIRTLRNKLREYREEGSAPSAKHAEKRVGTDIAANNL